MFRWDGVRRSQSASAIDAEGGVACGEKADDLARGGESGVGIGFSRLRTELFGRGIVAIAQGGGKFVVTIGADVGEIGEVGALHEERQEFVLVDDFLARRVDQNGTGAHEFDHFAIDKTAGAGRGGGVETDDVALLHEVIEVVCGVGTVFLDALDAIEEIVGADFHFETAGDASHTAGHVAIGQQPDALAAEFGAGCAVEIVTHVTNEQAEDEFGHGVGILPGRVHHNDITLGGGVEIHVVHAGTGAHHNAQMRSGAEHIGVDAVTADDEGVGIGHSGEQGGFVGVLFEQSKRVARRFDDVTDPFDGCGCEGFFGGDKDVHGFAVCW